MRYAEGFFLWVFGGVAAAAFILLSSESLPPVVAAHFDASGAANGFMPRDRYVAFMLLVTIGLPLLLTLPTILLGVLPPRFINLPDRDYWLAPERSADTIRFLRHHALWMAALVLLFLCFVHRLVVDANALRPPHFPASSVITGLAAFVLGLGVWLAALVLHFRKPG